MSEALFVLTIIFVAYVVYIIVNEQKETPKPAVTKAKPEVPDIIAAIQPIPEVVAKKIQPTKIKPATIKKTAPTPTAPNTVKKCLRDPKTGEVTTSYSNYRFTKRWIKDALVAEGLIEKVYTNKELEPAIEAAIKDALVKLEAIEKYKP